MKSNYITPEFEELNVENDALIMTSVTGNSSTENLTEETFEW